MKKKRKVSILLLSCALATSLAACQTTTNSAGGGQKTGTGSDKSGKSSTKTTTFNIMFNRSETNYPTDGGPGRPMILDALNKSGIQGVDFKVSLVAGQEYYTKLNLMASSGDLPDYFDINGATLTKFAQQGLIMPLDDFIQKMPYYRDHVDKAILNSYTINGKIYGLPGLTRTEAFNGVNVNGFIVRTDWLQNLGLKAPTTLDEFHDMLQKMTNGDPDKDGKKNTYGLGGLKPELLGDVSGFDGIFGAFGVGPKFWMERDGMLKRGVTLPETKQALALLQQWYKEGLIDREFPVTASKQLDEKFVNSKIGIYPNTAWVTDPNTATYKTLRKTTPMATVDVLIPPKGPQGAQGWPEVPPGANVVRAISAKAQDPDKLAKLLNWSGSDEPNGGFYLLTYGVEGKDYTYDKDKNRIKLITDANTLTGVGLSNPVQFVKAVDRRWSPDDLLQNLETTNKYLIRNQYWKTVPEEVDYPDLGKLWVEYFVKIVTGEYSVDKWDEFVKKYYTQGGQKIEDAVNAAWQKSKK